MQKTTSGFRHTKRLLGASVSLLMLSACTKPIPQQKPAMTKSSKEAGHYSLVQDKDNQFLLKALNHNIDTVIAEEFKIRYREYAKAASADMAADAVSSVADATVGNSGTESTASFSTTNLIEKSVDEADFVKQNANHVFLYSRQAQASDIDADGDGINDDNKIIKVYKKPSTKPIAKVSFNRDSEGEGLFLDDNQLLLLENTQPVTTVWSEKKQRHVSLPSFSRVTNYDISNPKDAKPINSYAISGQYKRSRKINNNLYMIMETELVDPISCDRPSYDAGFMERFLDKWTGESACKKKHRLTEASLKKKMPTDVFNKPIDPKDCYVPPVDATKASNSFNTKVTVINKIDLKNNQHESVCVFTSADNFYMSSNAMYFAYDDYLTSYNTNNTNSVVSSEVDMVTVDYSHSKTVINKFSIGKNINYAGAGVVSGTINQDVPSFSMNEHKGILRVATRMYGGPQGVYNMLHSLKESPDTLALDTIATLPNEKNPKPIGKPGEEIKGVRFMGDQGYVVTFRNSDPLYKIDFSDPENPKMVGELEMPGYSAYLHRISANYLMGVGYTVDERARPTGIQTTIFDISASPKIVAQHTKPIAVNEFKLLIDTDSKAISTMPYNGKIRVTILYVKYGNKTRTHALEYEINPKTGQFDSTFVRNGKPINHRFDNISFRALMHNNQLFYATDDGTLNLYVWNK